MIKTVDISEALEGEFVNVECVKNSPTKTAIVLDGGDYEEEVFDGMKQKKLTIQIELDGKIKKYRPNRDSIKNLSVYGRDTKEWVGKKIRLAVLTINGQERIIASPVMEDKPVQEEPVTGGN